MWINSVNLKKNDDIKVICINLHEQFSQFLVVHQKFNEYAKFGFLARLTNVEAV